MGMRRTGKQGADGWNDSVGIWGATGMRKWGVWGVGVVGKMWMRYADCVIVLCRLRRIVDGKSENIWVWFDFVGFFEALNACVPHTSVYRS